MDAPMNHYDGESLPEIETLRQDIDAYIDRYRPLGKATPSMVTQHLQYLDNQYGTYEAQLRLLLLRSQDRAETQTYLDFAYDIRAVIRDVYYEQAGVEAWDLPPMSAELHATSWDLSFRRARTLVAARLDWVLSDQALDRFFRPRPGRYEDLTSTENEELVRQRLPRQYSWLVDFSNRPSLEWVVFIQHVARLTMVEAGSERFNEELAEFLDAREEETYSQDGEISTESANAEDRAKSEDSCNICGHTFADSLSDDGAEGVLDSEAEVAVKIMCGHVFGESCLKSWVRTCTSLKNRITCPTCRTGLCEPPQGLDTDEIMEVLPLFTEARRAVALCDRDINEFLLWGMCNSSAANGSENTVNVHNKPYEHKIGDLLQKIESARLQLDSSVDRVHLALRNMLGPAQANSGEIPLIAPQL